MNKRHYILLTILILATAILSPSIFALKKIEVKKPDMEEIKRRITDSNDKYYCRYGERTPRNNKCRYA